MLTTDNSPRYTIIDLGFDKSISKQLFTFEDAPPEMQNLFLSGQASKNILSGEVVSKLEQIAGVLFNGKGSFTSTTAGYRLGIDTDDDFKFVIGDATNSMDWNVTTADTLTIIGAISASTITGGTIQTASSGKRIRIVSASATSPTQAANSLMLINASGSDILDFGSDSSVIMRILPTDTDQAGLLIQNNASLVVTNHALQVSVQNGSSTGQSIVAENAGSGTGISIIHTGSGDSMLVDHRTTAGVALKIAQATTGDAVEINMSGNGTVMDINKTATGAGAVFDVDNAGTGITLDILQSESSNALPAILVTNQGTSVVAQFTNSGSSSSSAVITLIQDTVVSTKFKRYLNLEGATIVWRSTDGTTPNGNLSGTAGDICLNGPSGQAFYCTGTTNWTGM